MQLIFDIHQVTGEPLSNPQWFASDLIRFFFGHILKKKKLEDDIFTFSY